MDISIVIVSYHSQPIIYRCLESLRQTEWHNLEYEIFVVDNAREADLAQELATHWPEVHYIPSNNIGYAAGNNLALRQASGKYWVIMNPDTAVEPNSIWELYNFIEGHPRAGMVGPRQYNPDGSRQDSGYRWHRLYTPFCRRSPRLAKCSWAQKELRRFLLADVDLSQACPVDWLLGSFLFIRAAAMRQVGYFDERYRLYFDDTDLSREMWHHGWQVVYCPEVNIIHNHQRASAQMPWYKIFSSWAGRQHVLSWFKYLLKWGPGGKSHVPRGKNI